MGRRGRTAIPRFLTPPPLEPGDSVAVIAPSSGGARDAPHVFELGLRRLRDDFGLEPVVSPTARQGNEFLTEPPRDEREQYRERLYATVVEQVGRYNPEAPVVLGLEWGHTTPVAPLPLGGRLELDPVAETVHCR